MHAAKRGVDDSDESVSNVHTPPAGAFKELPLNEMSLMKESTSF